MGSNGESVPAPEIAFRRYQPLAGLEHRNKLRALGAIDDADLCEAARQFRRCLDVLRQRGNAVGQCRIGEVDRSTGPAHRSAVADRGIKVVAKRRAERFLVTHRDLERIHHRRPEILALDSEQLADGPGFGFQPLHAAFGAGERLTRGFELPACFRMRGFGRVSRGLGLGERRLRFRQSLTQSGDVRLTAIGGRKTGLNIDKLRLQPRGALVMVLLRGLKLIAPGREVGKRAGQFGKGLFRARQRGISRSDPLVHAN
jgi:hypothetical protein